MGFWTWKIPIEGGVDYYHVWQILAFLIGIFGLPFLWTMWGDHIKKVYKETIPSLIIIMLVLVLIALDFVMQPYIKLKRLFSKDDELHPRTGNVGTERKLPDGMQLHRPHQLDSKALHANIPGDIPDAGTETDTGHTGNDSTGTVPGDEPLHSAIDRKEVQEKDGKDEEPDREHPGKAATERTEEQ